MLWIDYTLRSIKFTDLSFFSGSILLCLSPTLIYLIFFSFVCISWLCGNLNDCISGGGAVPVSSLSFGLLCVLCLQHSVRTYKTGKGILQRLAQIPESVNQGGNFLSYFQNTVWVMWPVAEKKTEQNKTEQHKTSSIVATKSRKQEKQENVHFLM